MTHDLPNLTGAAWLEEAPVRKVFRLLEGAGEEVRVVGGAVRNTLMQRPVVDADFATTATPATITALAEAAGYKAVPTGFAHGTVTLVVDRRGFEVTTLREDIETDGRRAVVRFGRDWQADALRRDFTVNALSVDSAGTIHDPVGGYPDIVARRIRFIGDADTRIAEDRLRILRLFRFAAEYGAGPIDAAGLSAAIRAREGLRDLSAERIGQEMRKLAVAERAPEVVAMMQDAGVLPVVLGGVGYIAQFVRTVAFEAEAGSPPSQSTRLGVLACRIDEDVQRVAQRLRLANVDRDRIAAMLSAARDLTGLPLLPDARRALYRHGVEAYHDGVVLAWAWSGAVDPTPWRTLAALPDTWTAPRFPLGGRDLISDGVRGPAIGAILRAVEAWWIAEDFAPSEADLRARLQQMVASQQ